MWGRQINEGAKYLLSDPDKPTHRPGTTWNPKPISLRTLNRTAIVLVILCIAAMVIGTYYSFVGLPPIPRVVSTSDGDILFTQDRLIEGKEVFHKYNLMSYGTLLGNGAYYGPDYTAEYLRFVSRALQDRSSADLEQIRTTEIVGDTLTVPNWWLDVHRQVQAYYVDFYVNGRLEEGVGPGTIPTVHEAERLADFIAWTAWISVKERPGSDGSYTNNWPYEPSLGNVPTPTNLFWTTLTVAIVLFLAALIVIGYEVIRVEPIPELPHAEPGESEISISQRALIPLFAIAALLFFIQTAAGGYIANAFTSRQDFYGIFSSLGLDRASVLPFSAVRAVHVDLGIFWVVGMWMASALFLAPFLGGRERPWLARVSKLMTWSIVISVVGTVFGIYLSVRDFLGESWFWLGSEGMEYVDMGRIWKYALLAGFVLWMLLLWGWYGPVMRRREGHIQRILVGIGIAISVAFLPSLWFLPSSHFVLAEFWRWWTVHLWVEGIFAFFQVAVTAIVLLNLRLVTREIVTKSVYLEGFLVVLAGTLAIGHHYWWVGQPAFWISIGSIFSTLEVVPLFLLLFHALGSYRKMGSQSATTVQRVAMYFIIASAVWQFIGSGVLGLIINFPIVNYYEHGTYLTVAHAHGSMLGGFGFLAIGLMLYGFRYLVPDTKWPEKPLMISFYLLNAGLFLMLFVSVVPVGIIQLNEVFTSTYDTARSLPFYEQSVIKTYMKLRLPGDTLIILGAAVLAWQVLRIWRLARQTQAESIH